MRAINAIPTTQLFFIFLELASKTLLTSVKAHQTFVLVLMSAINFIYLSHSYYRIIGLPLGMRGRTGQNLDPIYVAKMNLITFYVNWQKLLLARTT